MIAALGQDRAPRNLKRRRPSWNAGGNAEAEVLLPQPCPAVTLSEAGQPRTQGRVRSIDAVALEEAQRDLSRGISELGERRDVGVQMRGRILDRSEDQNPVPPSFTRHRRTPCARSPCPEGGAPATSSRISNSRAVDAVHDRAGTTRARGDASASSVPSKTPRM